MRPVLFACIYCMTGCLLQSVATAQAVTAKVVTAKKTEKVEPTRFYMASSTGKDPKVFYTAKGYYNSGSPAFSSDGKKLAFDVWKSQEGETISNVKIMVINADGTDQKILGSGAMPSWSPEGKRIAFSQLSPYGVAIMNADGSNRTLIEAGGWGAQWSPDGRQIAYTVRSSGKANVRIYDLIEDTKTDVFAKGESPYSNIYWNMAWSPDSSSLCFLARKAADRAFEVTTVKTAGKKPHLKVHFKGKISPFQDMAWHPSGDMIVFGSPAVPRQLLQFNPHEDKAPEPLGITVDGNKNGDVCFTPDGKHLLFTARDKPKPIKRVAFFQSDLKGNNVRLFLTPGDFHGAGSPTFSSDGKKFAFDGKKPQEGQHFSDTKIMVADADGSNWKTIGSGAMPSWSPGGHRIACSSISPRGVATMNADGSQRKLIDSQGWGAQWSPDGQKIAYSVYSSNGANIRIYDLIEHTKRDVYTKEKSPFSYIYWNMAWSNDSNWLCFKGRNASSSLFEVATVNIAGPQDGFKVHYKNKTAPYADFAWRPLKNRIVFGAGPKPLKLFHFNPNRDDAPKPLKIKTEAIVLGDVCYTADGKNMVFNVLVEE